MKKYHKYEAARDAADRWLNEFVNDNREAIENYLLKTNSRDTINFNITRIEYLGSMVRFSGRRIYNSHSDYEYVDIPTSILS